MYVEKCVFCTISSVVQWQLVNTLICYSLKLFSCLITYYNNTLMNGSYFPIFMPSIQNVCFLLKLFEQLQLDSEWSLNAGNWLWVSCSAFFHGQIPWYCPVNVGKKLDPSGNFIR